MKKLIFSSVALLLTLSSYARADEEKCISGNCINGKGVREVSYEREGELPYTMDSRSLECEHIVYHEHYEGTFKSRKKDGNGIQTLSFTCYYKDRIFNIDFVYDGKFKEDKRNGKGSATHIENFVTDITKPEKIYHQEITYQGMWENDERAGNGVETKKDRHSDSEYEGMFKNNEWNGIGRSIIYHDGKKFVREGMFKDGLYVFDKNGEYTGGIFYKNEPIYQLRNGEVIETPKPASKVSVSSPSPSSSSSTNTVSESPRITKNETDSTFNIQTIEGNCSGNTGQGFFQITRHTNSTDIRPWQGSGPKYNGATGATPDEVISKVCGTN